MGSIAAPEVMQTYSTPEYEAATDNADKLRYIAGADAQATYSMRLEHGGEDFHTAMSEQFFGSRRDAESAAR
jgi:hypothetical protein